MDITHRLLRRYDPLPVQLQDILKHPVRRRMRRPKIQRRRGLFDATFRQLYVVLGAHVISFFHRRAAVVFVFVVFFSLFTILATLRSSASLCSSISNRLSGHHRFANRPPVSSCHPPFRSSPHSYPSSIPASAALPQASRSQAPSPHQLDGE